MCTVHFFQEFQKIFYPMLSLIFTAILFSSLNKNASSSLFYSLSLVKMKPIIEAFYGSPLRVLNFIFLPLVFNLAALKIIQTLSDS
jgi:hypothetical protein